MVKKIIFLQPSLWENRYVEEQVALKLALALATTKLHRFAERLVELQVFDRYVEQKWICGKEWHKVTHTSAFHNELKQTSVNVPRSAPDICRKAADVWRNKDVMVCWFVHDPGPEHQQTQLAINKYL